jgi:hypothetical protein
MTSNHKWKFFKSGKLLQVCLESGEDLKHLGELDPKLWAAMVCPTKNLEFDTKTLEYLDTDHDNKIKLSEMVGATKWMCSIIKDPEVLIKPESKLPLDIISEESDEGKKLLASAKQILRNLGKKGDTHIGLEDLADTTKIFAATAFNGDGIITETAGETDEEKALISNIMACVGEADDRSGKKGISEALLDGFIAECNAYSAWYKKGSEEGVMFAADKSAELYGAFEPVKLKIDDYFTRCRLVSFDKQYETAGQALAKEYANLLKKSLSGAVEELKEMPLALATDKPLLPLFDNINPAWADTLATFATKVVAQLIGDTKTLTEQDWAKIKATIKPYESWLASKGGKNVEKLGIEHVDNLIASEHFERIRYYINRDKALEPQFNIISSVDKMIRYYKYLYLLLNNFASFRDFYSPEKRAVFQAGTLYMDSRSCELCVKVDDVGAHSAMAASSNIFLAYCQCIRQDLSATMNIVAGFTDGEADELTVGRNGIFVDRNGNYWDSVITKIVDHPISIRQAFWTPYKKIGKMINDQIEKFASSKDESLTKSISESVDSTAQKAQGTADASATPTAFDVGKFAGIFAAIGLALAAIGTAITSVVSGFLSLEWWQMPLALLGILLVISGPSMILAAMRLRKRSLGGILNANGWAINTKAYISISMGKSMTSMAQLPINSVTTYKHPYGKKGISKKMLIAVIIFAIAWYAWVYKNGCPFTKCFISSDTKVEETTETTEATATEPETTE